MKKTSWFCPFKIIFLLFLPFDVSHCLPSKMDHYKWDFLNTEICKYVKWVFSPGPHIAWWIVWYSAPKNELVPQGAVRPLKGKF